MIVSELATNALMHSASGEPGGAIDVELEVTARAVTIHVIDEGPRADSRADPSRDGSWGLGLVAALADESCVVEVGEDEPVAMVPCEHDRHLPVTPREIGWRNVIVTGLHAHVKAPHIP